MDAFEIAGKSIFEVPPKKKKKYILFLFKLSEKNEEKIRLMEKAIQKSMKDFILVRFEDPDEGLKALILKNVEIVILDSSLFQNDTVAIEYGAECKKRKKCPIIFIALNSTKLIEKYRENLYLYEEFDTYFQDPIDILEFVKKLQQLGHSRGRAAKRFSLNIPVRLFRLNNDQYYDLILSDISLVGFGIIKKHNDIFIKNEQFQLKLPLSIFKMFHPQYAEFLTLSGCLRRISIGGDILGFSIEHLIPIQMEVLCKLMSVLNYQSKLTKFVERPKEIAPPKRTISSDMM